MAHEENFMTASGVSPGIETPDDSLTSLLCDNSPRDCVSVTDSVHAAEHCSRVRP